VTDSHSASTAFRRSATRGDINSRCWPSLGYRVWAPGLRGFGQTDKPKGVAQYAFEHLIDDVAALIDVSRTYETLLLGHDWGVMIASQIAFHQVRPLSRLVLLNGAALGMQANTGLSLGALQRVSYAFFFQLPFRPERLLAAGNTGRSGRRSPGAWPDGATVSHRKTFACFRKPWRAPEP
jgi:pimeloyl-ACP methyl ester carboxylesterase